MRYPATEATCQNAYLRFRGLVADAVEYSEIYRQWDRRFLLDVNDETGEVVKLQESNEELKADIEALSI